MKIYQQYLNAIQQLGKLEVAWFTTFNLDVELVERFLLSAIVGKQPQELKTAEDYEGMNQDLQQVRSIRVWYDYRALNTNSPKRTTADIFSVDPKLFYNSGSKEIVFHPKVIFLKGTLGAILICGSANLTIRAWSNNREAVLIKNISCTENAIQIISFYESLYKISGSDELLFDSLKKWANGLKGTKSDWNFHHSLQSNITFIESLHGKELTTWSPYFSREANRFFSMVQEKGFQSITVVPDITPAGKVRIEPEVLKQLQMNGTIQFSRDKESYAADRDRLCHAKVWLTDKMLAVGSWNCSYRATGLGLPLTEQNIEAGILTSDINSAANKLREKLVPLKADSFTGIPSSELEQEWAKEMNRFTMDCKIYVDWEKFTFSLEADNKQGYFALLPHNPGKKIPLSEVQNLSFKSTYQYVLKNKSYQILDVEGIPVFTGFLIEINKAKRSAYGYVSLTDLFDSLLDEPGIDSGKKTCLYRIEQEESFEDSINQRNFIHIKGNESYYLMFVAFQKLYDSIESANGHTKLDDIGFRSSGSLLQITALVRDSINAIDGETDPDILLYHYFMACELNRCIQCFNRKDHFTYIPLDELSTESLMNRLNPEVADLKFIAKLKEIYEY
jgi:hypothetical protein